MKPRQQLEDQEPATVQNFTSERLAFAQEAETRLRSREKIGRAEDRAEMAKNLGRMFEGVKQRMEEESDSFPISKLFTKVFGERRGDSLYKKRVRLLTLSSDDEKANEDHVRYGSQYLDLVEALSCHLEFPEEWPDDKKYSAAVSQLIERTSYDYLGGYTDRAKNEYRIEIYKQLENIVVKVVEDKNVDLDWMRFWTTDHPVKIEGPTGSIKTLSNYDWNPPQYNNDTFSIHGRVDNRLAPCVRIARVISRYEISKYLPIKIQKPPVKITPEDIKKEISKLVREPFLEKYGDAGGFPEWLEAFEEIEGWRESHEKVDFHGLGIPANSFELYVESFIDLELRYNEEMTTWCPVILSRWPDNGGIATADECMCSTNGEKLIGLYWADGDEPVYAVLDEAADEYAKYMVFRTEIYPSYGEPSKLSILGQRVGCGFYPPHSEFDDFLLASMDDTPSEFDIKTVSRSGTGFSKDSYSYPIGYVKAPTNSLAFWILNNLAYAPEEERIDTLLLKDAREKYRILKDYADECEKNYDEAINRI